MKNDIEYEFMQGSIAQSLYSQSSDSQSSDSAERFLPAAISPRNQQWTRALAAGALVTGAALLLAGRKKGALIAAGLGAAAVLAEDPQAVREMWRRTPEYLSDGHALLERLEDVVENLTEQSNRVQQLLRRA